MARHVDLVPGGKCRCGKTNAQCTADWDKQLGITGRALEDYRKNLRAINNAKANGLDPFCIRLNARRKRGQL